jgi:hypothetical protein
MFLLTLRRESGILRIMNYRAPRYLLLRINEDRTVKVVGQFDYLPDPEDIENAVGDLTAETHLTLIDCQGCGSHVVANYRVEVRATLVSDSYRGAEPF